MGPHTVSESRGQVSCSSAISNKKVNTRTSSVAVNDRQHGSSNAQPSDKSTVQEFIINDTLVGDTGTWALRQVAMRSIKKHLVQSKMESKCTSASSVLPPSVLSTAIAVAAGTRIASAVQKRSRVSNKVNPSVTNLTNTVAEAKPSPNLTTKTIQDILRSVKSAGIQGEDDWVDAKTSSDRPSSHEFEKVNSDITSHTPVGNVSLNLSQVATLSKVKQSLNSGSTQHKTTAEQTTTVGKQKKKKSKQKLKYIFHDDRLSKEYSKQSPSRHKQRTSTTLPNHTKSKTYTAKTRHSELRTTNRVSVSPISESKQYRASLSERSSTDGSEQWYKTQSSRSLRSKSKSFDTSNKQRKVPVERRKARTEDCKQLNNMRSRTNSRSRSPCRRRHRKKRVRSRSYESSDSSRQRRRSRSSTRRKRSRRSWSSSRRSSSEESSPRANRYRRRRHSRSRSPRNRKRVYYKRDRSLSSSYSPDHKRTEPSRPMRHLSPPPFPDGNSNIYCIDPALDRERLTMRSLSPVSADIVSSTVENAWNFYYNRYYRQSGLSSEIIYDSQIEFLKSYSGFFTEPPYFENCYRRLLKPADLKSAMRMRLERLSPGPSMINSPVNRQQVSPDSTHVDSSVGQLPAFTATLDASILSSLAPSLCKTTCAAQTMETMIKAGSIPGITLGDDPTNSCSHDDINTFSNEQSPNIYSPTEGVLTVLSNLKSNVPRHSRDIKRDNLVRPHGLLNTDGQTIWTPAQESCVTNDIIPFLNDGTVNEITHSFKSGVEDEAILKVDGKVEELPWHYRKTDSHPPSPKSHNSLASLTQVRPTFVEEKPEVMECSSSTAIYDKARDKDVIKSKSPDRKPKTDVGEVISPKSVDDDTHVCIDSRVSESAVKVDEHPKDSEENLSKSREDINHAGDAPMSYFMTEVIKGIIRLATLQGETHLSPENLLRESELEQSLMHSRMTTAAGHEMIRMANCRLSEPHRLLSDFSKAGEEAVELMQTLDDRVVELIAGTPMLDE